MSKEEIIKRIRLECDRLYEKYEYNPLIESGLLDGFEDIIVDYCEDEKPY